jgi:ABC-type transport system involved in cytochrome c biogenesis ATPase subunit
MDTTAVLAAVIGGVTSALLVQIARGQDRRVRLARLAIVLTSLSVLTEMVTNGGGHSRTSHDIVFAVALTLLASGALLLMLGQGAARRAETPPS